MQLVGSVAELASEDDNLANDELGHTPRVGEGGVEDRDTMVSSVIEVDLVGTDAEAADHLEVLGLAKDFVGELGFRANADDVDITSDERLSAYPSIEERREGVSE